MNVLTVLRILIINISERAQVTGATSLTPHTHSAWLAFSLRVVSLANWCCMFIAVPCSQAGEAGRSCVGRGPSRRLRRHAQRQSTAGKVTALVCSSRTLVLTQVFWLMPAMGFVTIVNDNSGGRGTAAVAHLTCRTTGATSWTSCTLKCPLACWHAPNFGNT